MVLLSNDIMYADKEGCTILAGGNVSKMQIANPKTTMAAKRWEDTISTFKPAESTTELQKRLEAIRSLPHVAHFQ